MMCPYCNVEMTAGKIEAHGTRTHAIDGVFFLAREGGEMEDILEQTTREAFQCGDCATLIIKGRFADEETVPEQPYR